VLLFAPKHFLLFSSSPLIAMTCCLLLVKIGESVSVRSYCCLLVQHWNCRRNRFLKMLYDTVFVITHFVCSIIISRDAESD